MVGELGGCDALAAQCPMINGAAGISGDLGHLTVLGVDQNAAPPVAHSAVALDDGIISVYFHLFLNV